MMDAFILRSVFLLLYAIVGIQAYVNVKVSNNGNDLEINSAVTVTCTIQSDTNIMTLKIDDTPIAECTFGTCKPYQTSFPNLAFSFNTNDGVYNVTIDPLVLVYNGTSFKCDDGYTSDSHTLTIKEFDEPSASTTPTRLAGTTIALVVILVILFLIGLAIAIWWYVFRYT